MLEQRYLLSQSEMWKWRILLDIFRTDIYRYVYQVNMKMKRYTNNIKQSQLVIVVIDNIYITCEEVFKSIPLHSLQWRVFH